MTVSILLRKKYSYKTGSAFRATFVYIFIKKYVDIIISCLYRQKNNYISHNLLQFKIDAFSK